MIDIMLLTNNPFQNKKTEGTAKQKWNVGCAKIIFQGQSIEFFDYRINRIHSNAIERLKFDQQNQSNDNRINRNLKKLWKIR